MLRIAAASANGQPSDLAVREAHQSVEPPGPGRRRKDRATAMPSGLTRDRRWASRALSESPRAPGRFPARPCALEVIANPRRGVGDAAEVARFGARRAGDAGSRPAPSASVLGSISPLASRAVTTTGVHAKRGRYWTLRTFRGAATPRAAGSGRAPSGPCGPAPRFQPRPLLRLGAPSGRDSGRFGWKHAILAAARKPCAGWGGEAQRSDRSQRRQDTRRCRRAARHRRVGSSHQRERLESSAQRGLRRVEWHGRYRW